MKMKTIVLTMLIAAASFMTACSASETLQPTGTFKPNTGRISSTRRARQLKTDSAAAIRGLRDHSSQR